MHDTVFADIHQSIKRAGIWVRLGLSDTALKYRRSILGPFWLTLGMGITVLGLGTFWSLIWKVDLATFFPYLTAGILLWAFLVACLTEGAHCFAQQAALIRATPLPLFVHPLRLTVKIFLTFLHNSAVFILVAWYFHLPLSWSVLLVIPGMALLIVFCAGAALFLGILGARFRDFPPIVESVVPLLFFLTPVLWYSHALGEREYLAFFNPLTHLIAIVRQPMLGQIPDSTNYMVSGAVIVGLWVLALVAFQRSRTRLTLWV
jgi:ABC-2 type transport system permease protein